MYDPNALTDDQLTNLNNTSGTNTGDETTTTIKTKLGISTLSGSNTGDETTATINGKINRVITMQLVDTAVDVATGDYYLPIAPSLNTLSLKYANAYVITAGTTNATTLQIRNITKYASNDALSSAISIASAGTVGTAGTVDTSYDDVVTSDMIKITVTGVSTTAPKGLFVTLEYGA